MADPEPDPPVSVSTGEVRVGKAFEADRFPVPAIAFEIESLADEPVRIRLVDQIPESFDMEGVGFHPDYDSDSWTAYRDHRVAYERTLEPGESVLTVYGIRIDDPAEADAFLDEPTVDLIETDADPDAGDVLGRETTQVVRDALSGGDEDGLSDLGSGSLLGDPTPRDRADDPDDAVDDRDEDATAVDADAAADEGADAVPDETEAEEADETDIEEAEVGDDDEAEDGDDEAEDGDDEAVSSATAAEALDPRSGGDEGDGTAADDAPDSAEDEAIDSTVDDAPDSDEDGVDRDDGGAATPAAAGAESVAAALAAEVRAGRVDDDDLSVLREAFESGVPTSVDVRIGRLQSQIDDLLAYRDALADFLDENGTAEEVLGEVSEEVSELNDRVAALDESLSAAESERTELHDEISSAAEDVASLDGTVEGLDERLAEVETFETDIEELRTEMDELRSFRDQLSSALGPGEG